MPCDEVLKIADFIERLRADRKTENCSEKPNNCEWSVEYAKEMLNTMPCEDCGHWEHGAGDHYYCALLAMRQECCFESKDESTLMFANTPKDEPREERSREMKLDENQEAVNLLNNTKGSIENRMRTAYNLGYKDGLRVGINQTTQKLMDRLLADELQTERSGK